MDPQRLVDRYKINKHFSKTSEDAVRSVKGAQGSCNVPEVMGTPLGWWRLCPNDGESEPCLTEERMSQKEETRRIKALE